MTKQFRDLAKSLGLGKLDSAEETLRRMGRDIGEINSGLGATARQAEAAASAIKRMSRSEIERARAANKAAGAIIMPPPGALTVVGGGARGGLPAVSPVFGGDGAGGGGGGRAPVPFDAPFEPMPLNLRPSLRGRLGDALGGAREHVGKFREQVGLAEGAMAGISLMEPIHQAAEFDNVLTHIAITAGGVTGSVEQVRAKVAELSATYRAMALVTKQSSHDVAESGTFLITTGMTEQAVNKLLPMIGKSATAYNAPMTDAVQGAFSIQEILRIAPDDMEGALSAVALAAKRGHFSFRDFSALVPETATLAPEALKGREGLNSILASLETARRGAGSSGQAATNMKQFLTDLSGGIHSTKAFQRAGIDLAALRLNAEKEGLNPMEAVIEAIRRRTVKMTPARRDLFLGALFPNQESRIFVRTFLQEMDYYRKVKEEVGRASVDTINEDFQKAQNLHTRLAELSEKSHQLTQRVGEGFSWVVPVGNVLLGGVLAGLTGIDHVLPGAASGVMALTGGMLGLVAIMGVLGVVAGPVRAGFGLLKPLFTGLLGPIGAVLRLVRTNPLVGVSLLMIAAATDIWQHWDRFRQNFHWMWQGLRQAAGSFAEFIDASFSGDLSRAARAMEGMWKGVRQAWVAMWGNGGIMERLMSDFVTSLTPWGQTLANGLGVAMQSGYAAIEKSLDGWRKLFTDFKPGLPDMPFMAPPNLDDPSKFQKYKPGSTETPLRVTPGSYDQPSQPSGAAPRIHVTFEADVPGRARVRGDDGTVWHPAMRGPTLSRA